MVDEIKVTFTGDALSTLRSLGAIRNQKATDVLNAALSHEEWLTGCAVRGESVYAEDGAYRYELKLPEVAAALQNQPGGSVP